MGSRRSASGCWIHPRWDEAALCSPRQKDPPSLLYGSQDGSIY